MICEDTLTYGWVNGWGHVKSLKIDLIEIIQFCLKIYDLWRHPHLWVGGWMGSCQITTKN